MSKSKKNHAQDCNQPQDNTQEQKKKNNNQQSDQMKSENSRNR